MKINYVIRLECAGLWLLTVMIFALLPVRHAMGAEAYQLSRSAPYSWYLQGLIQEMNGEYDLAYTSLETAAELDPEAVPVMMELARVAIRLGRKDDAEKWTEQALVVDPDSIRLKMLLARIYAAGSKTASAIAILDEVLHEEPENEEALFLLGSLYAQTQNLSEAVATLEKAAEQKGTRSFMAHYYLGKIYLEKGETQGAREEFLKAISANPRFMPIYFDLAETYEQENDTENALKMWRSILQKQPENPRAAARTIELLLDADRLDDAISVLDRLNLPKADSSALRFKVAIMCLQKDRPDQALTILEPMAAKYPANNRILFYTGLAQEQSGNIDGAIRILRSIDADDQLGTEATVRTAYLLQKLGRNEESQEFLERRMATAPHNPHFILALSRICEENGEIEKAISQLEKFADSGNASKEIFMQLAMLCEKQGRRKQALSWAQRALEKDSEYVAALNFLGYTWAEEGINLDRAEEMIKKAVSLQPGDGYIVDSLGWIYFVQGRYSLAVKELEHAHHLVPDDPTISEHLGDALMKKQKYFRALKIYRLALQHEKERKNVRRLRKKVKQAIDMMSDMVDQ